MARSLLKLRDGTDREVQGSEEHWKAQLREWRDLGDRRRYVHRTERGEEIIEIADIVDVEGIPPDLGDAEISCP